MVAPPRPVPEWAHITDWQERAALAQHSIVRRHLVRSFFLPFTATGMSHWPYLLRERITGSWNFWWQAHLIDCMTDAVERADTPTNRLLLRRLTRTHYWVNGRLWRHNPYYDDLAWVALAVQRAQQTGYLSGYQQPLRFLRNTFEGAHHPQYGIPWRVGENFWNTPANGPVALFVARCGDAPGVELAEQICDWMYRALRLTEGSQAGLYADGLRLVDGIEKRVEAVYTYCQGVAMGAELELALRTEGEQRREHMRRVCDIVEACERALLLPTGVIRAGGGGDGGLFKGILVRYLAEVAVQLPRLRVLPEPPSGTSEALWNKRLEDTQQRAVRMVMTNAQAAWETAEYLPEGVLFSAKWNRLAEVPAPLATHETPSSRGAKVDGAVGSSAIPEQDMSTQLSGWMAVEAAARLVRAGCVG